MNSQGLISTIILLILNLIVVIVTFIYSFFCKKGKRCTVRIYALFFLFCPVIGFFTWGMSQLIFLIWRVVRFDFESLSFSTARENLSLPPDTESEMNYVPVLDALVTEDTGSLRSLMLDLLKSKSVLEVNVITSAVVGDDAETSHYAASAITNYLSFFRAGVQQRLNQMQKTPHDPTPVFDAISFLDTTLGARIMDAVEQRSYIYTLAGVMQNLYDNFRWNMMSAHYRCITDYLIEIKDFGEARKWVQRAKECRPGELDTLKARIHLSFATSDREELFAAIEEAKHTEKVVFDKEMIDFIRMIEGAEK